MTNTQFTVEMKFPDADREIDPRTARVEVACRLADYAARRGMVLTCAPRLKWTKRGLRATAPAHRAGRHPFTTPTEPGPAPVPACSLHESPGWWVSESAPERAAATGVCRDECPLIDACLAGALARREPFGVWGSRDFTPRRVVSG